MTNLLASGERHLLERRWDARATRHGRLNLTDKTGRRFEGDSRTGTGGAGETALERKGETRSSMGLAGRPFPTWQRF
jgi:hypothetical protein